MKTLKKSKRFSIVEVIVVCAVVAILASLIMSASSSVREAGRKTTCLNNLKQIQSIYEAYRKDHRKAPAGDLVNHDDFSFAEDYVSESDLGTFICPGDNSNQLVSIGLNGLDGYTSYSYIPTEAYVEPVTGFVPGDYEVASNDRVALGSLKLVAFDNNDGNHKGNRNIVYFNGSGNSKSGIAQTLKAGSFDFAELASNNNANEDEENASNEDEENASNEDEENASNEDEENASNEDEGKTLLEEAQEELEAREDELTEASTEAEEAEEAAREAEEAQEAAKQEDVAKQEEATEAQENKNDAEEELAKAEEALEQAKEALENGPQGYDSENVTLPEDNKGNEIIVNTDVRVTFELLGSGFSSNSIYSDVSVGGDTYKWQNEDGENHSQHVVGVEGLTLDLDVETGLTIAINGRSSYYDSSNLQGKSNLMVYRDGDEATSVGGYNGQDSVKTFLSDYIDKDGNVTIGADQVIFLMELGTTNKSKSYYDMQDLVVLATFEIVSTKEDVADLEKQVQEIKEALVTATTDADNAAKAAAEAAEAAAKAELAAEAAVAAEAAAKKALEEAEEAVLAAEEKEAMCQKDKSSKNENNGFGNGDQDAPGNSLENNNAENAQGDESNSEEEVNSSKNQNNGFGNGDQDAPGNSLENNNAENAQGNNGNTNPNSVEVDNSAEIAQLEAKIVDLRAEYEEAVSKGQSKKAARKLERIQEKQAELAELQ
ncbi:hypothetical protein PQO01_19235 [Lentisphaera marina]|uniref:DUF1559 family PulG-like putative transporter n=1 Tax=Lentisphaera marina TaxID=1111041 RepID=UPI0023663C9C|nr:DUF1559 domain-containing protein [Lentisphaera marina]MDD7987090.1 hypothetical protein [Lentisphaera marina]